jgi:hypothetical protein
MHHGGSPDNVDGVALMISLQGQHARTLGIIGVVLDHYGLTHAGEDITDQNAISRQLIVAMCRDPDLTPVNQVSDESKCSAHGRI